MTTPNQKLAEKLSNESFTRWIKGDASDYEKQQWDAWEQEDPAHRELSSYAEIFYQMRLELDPAEDLEIQLNKLNQRIARTKEKQNRTLLSRIKHNRSLKGHQASIAATIVLFLSMLGLLYLYNPTASPEKNDGLLFKTAETGYGETSSLKFSDGSLIRLNANSSLRYSLEQFNSDRVEVWLQGEGYFDIVSNPGGNKREFIVHTDDGRVSVLGTRFNVNTRFQKTSVVLEEGRVEVSDNNSLDMEAAGKILRPGERAVIDKNSSDIVLQKVDVGMFTAWINGEMKFHNTPLKDIFTSIEAIYNVKLDVESPELLEYQITGIVQNPDLQILLTGIEEILDLQIKQVNNKKFLISRKST